MMRRGVAVLFVAAAATLLASGCPSAECESQGDCERKKGSPPEGQQWVCADNTCRTEPVGGEQPDGGGQPDGGAQPDGGEQPDAGPAAGSLAKGETCTASVQCQPGLRCEMGTGGTSTCQALHLAFTVTTGGSTTAAVVRYDTPEAAPTLLGDGSKWPRWSRSGDAVAFVTTSAGGERLLVRRDVVPAVGDPVVLTDGGTAGTADFHHLEWGPGQVVAWTTSANGMSGVFAIGRDGGQPYQVTANGGFASFSADGMSIAYNNAGDGLLTAPASGSNPAGTPVSGGTGGVEPFHNRANNTLLYLRPRTGDTVSVEISTGGGGSQTQPLYSLYAVPAGGGTPTAIDEAPAPQTTSAGQVEGYFVSYHTVSDNGTLAAYTRTKYSGSPLPTTPKSISGNDVYVQLLDPATGLPLAGTTPQLLVSSAVQPSVSPEARFIAYVAGGQLNVQELEVTPGDGGTPLVTKVGGPVIHTGTGQAGNVSTAGGDEARPRWQPR